MPVLVHPGALPAACPRPASRLRRRRLRPAGFPQWDGAAHPAALPSRTRRCRRRALGWELLPEQHRCLYVAVGRVGRWAGCSSMEKPTAAPVFTPPPGPWTCRGEQGRRQLLQTQIRPGGHGSVRRGVGTPVMEEHQGCWVQSRVQPPHPHKEEGGSRLRGCPLSPCPGLAGPEGGSGARQGWPGTGRLYMGGRSLKMSSLSPGSVSLKQACPQVRCRGLCTLPQHPGGSPGRPLPSKSVRAASSLPRGHARSSRRLGSA